MMQTCQGVCSLLQKQRYSQGLTCQSSGERLLIMQIIYLRTIEMRALLSFSYGALSAIELTYEHSAMLPCSERLDALHGTL